MKTNRLALFLIWLMMLVAYLDRVNITIAGPTIMRQLHISPTAFGAVLSAFSVGYALMQMPGGWLADRFGARPILVAALLIWSAFTALTGRAASLSQLIKVRMLFGFGEGIENGAQFKLIADRFDERQRSQANALFLSALALGPALASPIASWLIVHLGWRAMFLCFALVGLVVAAVLACFLPVAQARQAADLAPAAREPFSGDTGLLSRPKSWLTFAAYLFFNIAVWGFIAWMPTYLSQTRHITPAHLGPSASIPYLCGFAGMVAIGWLGTRALYRYRAAVIGVGYLLSGGFLAIAFRALHVPNCLAGLSAAAFFRYGGFGPFWAVALEGTPSQLRGAFSGFVNFGGQIGGFIAPVAVGRIVELTHSFTDGFLFMIAGLVLSAVSLFVLQAINPSTEVSPAQP